MDIVIQVDESVGHIASRVPNAHRVFMNHGIDFCCGGHRPLKLAAKESGITPDALIDEIRSAVDSGTEDHVNWEERTQLELIAHIVEHYHRPLRDSLPRLVQLADKVVAAHGERHGESLIPLQAIVHDLHDELLSHLDKEEQILFPMITSGKGNRVGGPIRVMEAEHQDAGDSLERIRELTGHFQLPDDACNTYRAYWQELESFDRELRKHIHLENNVLFPKAVA